MPSTHAMALITTRDKVNMRIRIFKLPQKTINIKQVNYALRNVKTPFQILLVKENAFGKNFTYALKATDAHAPDEVLYLQKYFCYQKCFNAVKEHDLHPNSMKKCIKFCTAERHRYQMKNGSKLTSKMKQKKKDALKIELFHF
ncbi:hypothetical protein T07_2288 [Trichinella nelsoni]|uniref:Uncharacterized protein n=1 Tax=Trichinella nelsoni TaxID=6336 RepID=A0A0V0SFV7_9BILA|nr:hypothetical protein T07_2288 [Trichinella nelsoni]